MGGFTRLLHTGQPDDLMKVGGALPGCACVCFPNRAQETVPLRPGGMQRPRCSRRCAAKGWARYILWRINCPWAAGDSHLGGQAAAAGAPRPRVSAARTAGGQGRGTLGQGWEGGARLGAQAVAVAAAGWKPRGPPSKRWINSDPAASCGSSTPTSQPTLPVPPIIHQPTTPQSSTNHHPSPHAATSCSTGRTRCCSGCRR